MKTVALVAGEASGDRLGAELVHALKAGNPNIRFIGIGGDRMRAAGVETLWHSDRLAVFGLFEIVGDLFRIWRIRRKLFRHLRSIEPDLFVGIDAPDFNLGLERRLKRHGVITIHLVSPTVWAWRAGRIRTIARAADRVLCLFPFEVDHYRRKGVPAEFIGHPLADRLASRPLKTQRNHGPSIALLPGSRVAEINRLAPLMVASARLLAARIPGIRFSCALADGRSEAIMRQILSRERDTSPGTPAIVLSQGNAHEVIAAAEAVIVASGTATLETMLINRPMVVVYRLSAMTALLLRAFRLVKTPYFALPNILAGRALVPELIQEGATPEAIADAVRPIIEDEGKRALLCQKFESIGSTLRQGAAARAAAAILTRLEVPH